MSVKTSPGSELSARALKFRALPGLSALFLSGCDHGKLLRQGKQEGEAPRLGVAGRGGALPERSALEHALHQAGRAGGARGGGRAAPSLYQA